MRSVRFLIKEARENTNTLDKEAISDSLCINLLNRSLRYLVATLYNLNVRTKLFRKEHKYDNIIGQSMSLKLPIDIYAKNAIISLRSDQDDSPVFINQISDKNRGSMYGYIVDGDTIRVSGNQSVLTSLILTYAKKIPLFGLPFAKVVSIAGDQMEIDSSSLLSDECDLFTVINPDGEILRDYIGFTQAGTFLTIKGDLPVGIPNGSLIIPGQSSTTHCELPEELDAALITMLEALIFARQSSTDLQIGQAISADYIATLSELFADNSVDTQVPPVLEYSEWV